MNGYQALEMMKEGKIVCVTNCVGVGYRLKNGFIVEQDLIDVDKSFRLTNFDFDLNYEVFDEKMLDSAYVKFTEKELRSLINFLCECHNYLAINFESMKRKEIKKLYRKKRRLSYDCNFYRRRFIKERAINYTDYEELKQFHSSFKKIKEQMGLIDEEKRN